MNEEEPIGEELDIEAPLPKEEGLTLLEQIRLELEEADKERSQFRSLAQRVQADFINYRRRVEEERETLQKDANTQLLLHLLPIMDDLQRALMHGETQDNGPAWLEGFSLIYRKLQGLLEREGVTAIEITRQNFDPWEHEAILYQESPDHQEGEIVSVLQEGYMLHGKVLRPAQVVVAKTPPHWDPNQPKELDNCLEDKEG